MYYLKQFLAIHQGLYATKYTVFIEIQEPFKHRLSISTAFPLAIEYGSRLGRTFAIAELYPRF
jgi:hypothetical protein